MALSKWVGIGAGWFLAGPIGAIIGYYISKSFFDGKNDQAKAYEISLLILSSLVIKSDGKIVKAELTKASIEGAGTKIFNDAYTYNGSLAREENAIASAIAKGFKEDFKSPYGPQPMPNSPQNQTSLGVFVGNGTTDHLNKNFAGINLTTGGNSNKTTINTCTNIDDCANNIFTCIIDFSDY